MRLSKKDRASENRGTWQFPLEQAVEVVERTEKKSERKRIPIAGALHMLLQ